MDSLYKKSAFKFFFVKRRVWLKEVLWEVLWVFLLLRGVLWGRAMAAVPRSIDRTPLLCYGTGRVAHGRAGVCRFPSIDRPIAGLYAEAHSVL